ncbi:MAG: choline kinase family protein [Actinomycetota bacterium]|nr:choline kinase family protein [Actinomycetota bacterium]
MVEVPEIVALLEPELGPANAEPQPLSGGITNRNFRLRFGDRECVLRLTAAATELLGIDRDSERLAGDAAAALGIAPAVLASGPGFLVTEYLDCEPVSSTALRSHPQAAARALRTFHDSGLRLPNRFWVPDLLEGYADVVRERGGKLPAEYARAQGLVERIDRALPAYESVPCHDDLLAANLLAPHGRAGQIMLVDWEYAGMGHRMFDLGNLAVNNEFDEAAEDRLLEAYFAEPPGPERRATLALMRILSDAREAAWGVVQGVVSEIEFDFGDYSRRHFARLEQAAADPRLEGRI